MIVGGNPLPALQGASGISLSAATVTAEPSAAEVVPTDGDVKPTYFRTITTISYGSLASAYQAMKAQEASASTAILSGLGIPSAMTAYEDALETGLS